MEEHLHIEFPTRNTLWSWKKQRCRDGVMNEFVSWCRHLLVSFLFHALTSLHPPSNDYSTCSTHFSWAKPQQKCCACTYLLSTRMRTRTCVNASCSVCRGKSPTIYHRREKSDRSVSVHTSVDCGDASLKNQRFDYFQKGDDWRRWW